VLAGTRPRTLVGENPDFSAAIVDKALDSDARSTTGDDDADEHDNREYALLLYSTLHGGHPSTLHSPANPLRCFRRTYILWQALRFFGSIFLQSFCSTYDGLFQLSSLQSFHFFMSLRHTLSLRRVTHEGFFRKISRKWYRASSSQYSSRPEALDDGRCAV